MVRIITDSAADFELQEMKNLDILCIPMQVAFGDAEYRENENLTKEQFYDLLENSGVFPKTSQPSPHEFEKLLKEFMDSGDECVVITISSALSGTYQNALLVRNMLGYDNCYVIDSLNATVAERLLVEYAAKLRDEGKNAKEIADAVEQIKGKVKLYACIDTLEYLHKGGRLSKTSYTVGTLANIKPIIYVSQEGKVEVLAKALSMKSGINSVCKKMRQYAPDARYPIYIAYSNNRKNGEALAEGARKAGYEIPTENIVNIGATIGAHVGSNACGIIYVTQ